jgi:uncharacterized protein (DUF488 family)
MNLYTIGFTKKSAEDFFTRLSKSGVKKVVDIRLNNASQLAGFTKGKDLKFFLKSICDIDYEHRLDLAPTQEILDDYKKGSNDWTVYENNYREMLAKRKIESSTLPASFNETCLLCSEDKPEKCHRLLLAEYLQDKWGDVTIIHL